MYALKVENLTKRYPSFLLDNVCFGVGQGRIVGLVGANGAGKSTVIKGIIGAISISGSVQVFGKDFRTNVYEIKQSLGYAGGGFRVYPSKPLKAIGKVVSQFYSGWNDSTFKEYLKKYKLDENKQASQLSEGMKVKFSIALAMSHNARLLILDEPTSGLDPLSREEFCDDLTALVRDEGVSVLFSTHITSDLSRVADDVIILSEGKVLANKPINALLAEYSVAEFSDKASALSSRAIGIKQTKEGYSGLIAKGGEACGARISDATIDDIMVYLERERRGA